jgi:hypothetical protein
VWIISARKRRHPRRARRLGSAQGLGDAPALASTSSSAAACQHPAARMASATTAGTSGAPAGAFERGLTRAALRYP